MRRPPPMVLAAFAFEGGLALLALLGGWLLGWSPLATVPAAAGWTEHTRAVLAGCAAALPLVATLLILDRNPWRPLREIARLTDELLPALFAGASLWQLAVVSLLAGLGEELLFRGLIQAGLGRAVGGEPGAWLGLVVASALFGLAHPITLRYALVSGLVGAYLGGLLLVAESLLAPIAAHALYDFIALVYLLRFRERGDGEDPAAPEAGATP